jgi:hypothetical protein
LVEVVLEVEQQVVEAVVLVVFFTILLSPL